MRPARAWLDRYLSSKCRLGCRQSDFLHEIRRILSQGLSGLKQDAPGPLKLHWQGKDARAKDKQVWLERKRWEEAGR